MKKNNDIKQIYTFDDKVENIEKDLLSYQLCIFDSENFIYPNLMVDKEDGKPLGLEITDRYTKEYCNDLLSIGKERFVDLFYIEELWKQFSEVIVNDKFEENGDSTLAEDFHIWESGTKIDDIKKWFSENYITFNFDKLEEKYPLNFIDKKDVVYTFINEGTNYPKEIDDKDIKDIKLVNYWQEKLESNDGLLVKDGISYCLAHKSPKHEGGYQLSIFQDKELTQLVCDNQYSSCYSLAKNLANYKYKLIEEYSLGKQENNLKKQDKNKKISIKEIVNRAIKKAKEYNKKIVGKEVSSHIHER